MKKILLLICLLPLLLACNSGPAASTSPANDGFAKAQGQFYCEGMVAADGLGCMIKLEGTVYKMQRENGELYEESAAFDKTGQPVTMEVEYKKTGQHHKLMDGSNGPELIMVRSVKPVE
jgi:hypothetical protein